MKHIKLTKSQIAIVDDKDFELVNKYKWHNRGGIIPYVCRSIYVKGKNPKSEYLHRMLMKPKKGYFVDHINGDTFDNRRRNLRLLSNAENCRNRTRLNKNNRSGFRGVCKWKNSNNWCSQITYNKKVIYLGSFKDKVDAAKAYNDAAKTYFGEYAQLNPI